MPNTLSPEKRVFTDFLMRIDSMSDEGPGGGAGTACVMGVIDAYRTVWSPRAFGKSVLTQFISDGFMTNGHDWEHDIATIDSARVSGNELSIEWSYYNTDNAQEVRQKCKDRMDRKKTVGLSIGASVNWDKVCFFDSGEKLWTYAEGLGEDMSLYDVAIRKHKGFCGIIPEVTRLYETAITMAAAVPGSKQAEARSLDDLLRSGALGAMTFAEHLDLALGAVQGIEARAIEIEALRDQKGRVISPENRNRLTAIRDSISGILARSEKSDADPEAANRAFDEAMVARLFG